MSVLTPKHHELIPDGDTWSCRVCRLKGDAELTTHCLNRFATPHERQSSREGWDFADFAWHFVGVKSQRTDPITQPIPTCLNCERELSTYLDAYYGTDPVARSLCAGCRAVRARSAA